MIRVLKDCCFREQQAEPVFFAFEGEALYERLTELLGSEVSEVVCPKLGSVTTIPTLGKIPNAKVHVLGLGKKSELTSKGFRKAFAKLFRQVDKTVSLLLRSAALPGLDVHEMARLAAETYHLACYQLPSFKSKSETKTYDLVIISDQEVEAVVRDAEVNALAVNEARNLGNMPANLFFPVDFAKKVRQYATEAQLECEVLDKATLQAMGAGALLGVNQGAASDPYMVCVKYRGAGEAPFTALVGKGICFDSGGYSLKSSQFMRGMKHDKCGAVNCFYAFQTAVSKGLKVNLMLVLPLTENMISGTAQRVDDVVTSLSKKTIEIDNTDAEGRLILADAITYAQQQGATTIIDMATLTGACVGALSEYYTGTFTNDQELLNAFHQAANAVDEEVWQLPLNEEFTRQVKDSKLADLVNCSASRYAGASTAAAFLQEFIEEGNKWIHLDIAGSGMLSGDGDYTRSGASGVMVRTLVKFLENSQK